MIASAKEMTPFSLIEKQGFILLAQELINIGATYGKVNVERILSNRKSVSNHIDNIDIKLKGLVIEELKNIKAIGIICDHWVHDFNKNIYLTITYQRHRNKSKSFRISAEKCIVNDFD